MLLGRRDVQRRCKRQPSVRTKIMEAGLLFDALDVVVADEGELDYAEMIQ